MLCTRVFTVEAPETSPRNDFNSLLRAPPGTGLSCPRHPPRLHASQPVWAPRDHASKLDASVGAPGPHGFAVRNNAARLARHSRPLTSCPAHAISCAHDTIASTASHLHVRDDRDTPLFDEAGCAKYTIGF